MNYWKSIIIHYFFIDLIDSIRNHQKKAIQGEIKRNRFNISYPNNIFVQYLQIQWGAMSETKSCSPRYFLPRRNIPRGILKSCRSDWMVLGSRSLNFVLQLAKFCGSGSSTSAAKRKDLQWTVKRSLLTTQSYNNKEHTMKMRGRNTTAISRNNWTNEL